MADQQLDIVNIQINDMFGSAATIVAKLSNQDEIKELTKEIGKTNCNPNIVNSQFIKPLFTAFNIQENLRAFAIGTEEGGYFQYPDMLSEDAANSINYDARKRSWYVKAKNHIYGSVITDPYITAISGKLTIAVAHAIVEDNKPIGVFVEAWNLEKFQKEIENLKIEFNGDILVLNKDNRFIISSDHPEWLAKTPAELDLPDLQDLESKTEGLHLIKANNKYQYMRVKINDAGWKFISIIPVKKLYQEIWDIISKITQVCFTTLFIILGIVWLRIKKITQHIYTLSQAASAFGIGKTEKVNINSDDEIGLLAKTFNEMLEKINNAFIEIEQRNKKIAQLNSLNLVGEMSASIAHEIRNPMTTVSGYLQFIAKKEPKYNSQFEVMIDELNQANKIISEFLSLAKNKVVEKKRINLNNIITAIYPLIKADALNYDKIVEINLGEVPELELDETEIRQLILNFTRNGLEAMDKGGTLTIRSFIENDKVVLAIKDEGTGIDAKILDNIGIPFMTTKENGTGLGLAVCYRIASRHNATIDLETNSNGTTFYINFNA